jgi:hypothetical protein
MVVDNDAPTAGDRFAEPALMLPPAPRAPPAHYEAPPPPQRPGDFPDMDASQLNFMEQQ